MAYAFAECRDLGHVWFIQAVRTPGGAIRWVRTLRCRCGTVKTQSITSIGSVRKNSYHYPKGYLRPGERAMVVARESRLLVLRLRQASPRWLVETRRRVG